MRDCCLYNPRRKKKCPFQYELRGKDNQILREKGPDFRAWRGSSLSPPLQEKKKGKTEGGFRIPGVEKWGVKGRGRLSRRGGKRLLRLERGRQRRRRLPRREKRGHIKRKARLCLSAVGKSRLRRRKKEKRRGRLRRLLRRRGDKLRTEGEERLLPLNFWKGKKKKETEHSRFADRKGAFPKKEAFNASRNGLPAQPSAREEYAADLQQAREKKGGENVLLLSAQKSSSTVREKKDK